MESDTIEQIAEKYRTLKKRVLIELFEEDPYIKECNQQIIEWQNKKETRKNQYEKIFSAIYIHFEITKSNKEE